MLPRLSNELGDVAGAVLFGLVGTVYIMFVRYKRMDLLEQSHREAARHQLAETEKARLSVAIEQAAEGVLIADSSGTIQYANPAFTKMTGYRADEAVGRNPRFLKSGKQDRTFYDELWKTITSGETWRGELVNRRKDGSFYNEELTITPIRDADGAITNFIAIKQDVTDRKAAEDARRFLASIVEESEEAIIGQTPEGVIMSWNRGAETLYGYRADEVIGKPVSMIVWPDRHEVLRQVTERVKRGERIAPFEGTAKHKDGSRIEVSLSLSPIQDAGGRVIARAAIVRDISVRKQAEKTSALLASIVESSDDAIFSSLNGTIATWNQGAERIYGYRADEIIGKSIFVLAPPDRQDEVRNNLERTWRGENVSHFETVRARKDGTLIDVSLTLSPIRDASGEVIGEALVAHDISRRKRAEEALRKSEAQYRSLVDNVPDIFWTAGTEGRPIFISNNIERIYGYTLEEIRQTGAWFNRIHPEDAARVQAEYEALLTEGRPFESEYRIQRKDGDWIWFYARAKSHYEKDGQRYIDGIASDITARKQTEEALKLSEQRYRLLFERNLAGVIRTCLDGRILDCNHAFAQMLGYTSREEVLALNTQTFYFSPEDRAPLEQKIKMEQVITNQEVKFRRRDGSPIWALINLTLVAHPDCKAGTVEGTIIDITDRKRAEEELIKAREAAEAASRAKSDFLANMSHEIRTPMNGVIGMTELALETDLTPEQRDYLNTVKSSADALLGVINDILDFSKIEARKLDLEDVTFDLRACVDGTLKAMGIRASQKNIELACHIAADVPQAVIGDPVRIRQVLINLIGNAIKFTEHGEVVVRVGRLADSDGQVTVQFSVTDTGIGIPPAQQESVYQAFVQADASNTRRFGGTGLGLAIASQLVGMMGGQMKVESETGRGTAFYFTVRLGIAAETEQPIRARIASLEKTSVLLVDDHATNRRILGQVVNRWGMHPTLASDGPSALETLRRAAQASQLFPLVIVDSHMPEMDGFALIECMKQDSLLGSSRVIMLTSAGRRGEAARCRELGVGAYLTKPVGEAELLETILRVLGTQTIEPARPPLITQQSLSGLHKSLKILVVEDNSVNQRLAVRLVEKQGHAVRTASTGREALAALEKEHFDLALMDVQMPEMDGLEATRAIREKELLTGDHLHIIAMTAHAMQGDSARCLAAGMDDYIAKPVQVKGLAAAIERATHAPSR